MNTINQYEPEITEDDIEAINNYLRSGGYITEFRVTRNLEDALSSFCKSKEAIIFPNGTLTLYAILKSLNIDFMLNINFNLFEKFISQFSNLKSIVTNQKKFLTSMGILQRAEMVSKNIPFSKKADLFYRIRRLIDERQMGTLFKVMLIKNNKNKFKTGFQIYYQYIAIWQMLDPEGID